MGSQLNIISDKQVGKVGQQLICPRINQKVWGENFPSPLCLLCKVLSVNVNGIYTFETTSTSYTVQSGLSAHDQFSNEPMIFFVQLRLKKLNISYVSMLLSLLYICINKNWYPSVIQEHHLLNHIKTQKENHLLSRQPLNRQV